MSIKRPKRTEPVPIPKTISGFQIKYLQSLVVITEYELGVFPLPIMTSANATESQRFLAALCFNLTKIQMNRDARWISWESARTPSSEVMYSFLNELPISDERGLIIKLHEDHVSRHSEFLRVHAEFSHDMPDEIRDFRRWAQLWPNAKDYQIGRAALAKRYEEFHEMVSARKTHYMDRLKEIRTRPFKFSE
jgi:hypothetical protein